MSLLFLPENLHLLADDNLSHDNNNNFFEKKQEASQEPEEDLPLPTTPIDIIFDPLKHQTQSENRGLCTDDKIYYIEKEWTSIPLCISDYVSSKESKTQQDAKLGNSDLDSYAIPQVFLKLINREITNKEVEINEESYLNKKLWIAFGKWIGFKEPIGPRETITKKANLIIKAQKDFSSLDGLKKLHYVVKPECITDLDGKTLIHLE
ncbi:13437_t:CDS:2 [Entrophospora sp. SA101]|nr:13434_t:CDS:2 [Entrophospora sp. SA101]CAJ0848021.1 13437_t:CDS:2 [Entrophospora sp. SA101]